MSWTTFQPHGSSSTIKDFYKKYSRTLNNYLKRLQDYSNYYSGLQRARGLVGHTPWVPARKEEGGLLLEFPCNPTRTHTVLSY
jgi:hypothetical protein